MERKDFIKRMAVNSSLAVVAPAIILQSCEKEETPEDINNGSDISLDLTDSANEGLLEDGGFMLLTSRNIIVINTGNITFTALSSKCTHQQCTVSYNSSSNNLPCPCHGSVFNIDGGVVNGPANSPLQKYQTELSGNSLIIKTG